MSGATPLSIPPRPTRRLHGGLVALAVTLQSAGCDEAEGVPTAGGRLTRAVGAEEASNRGTTGLRPAPAPTKPHHVGTGGMRPPTPTPGFLEERCATFVDRSAAQDLEFSVVIASEDREGLEGELGDDHTFQFFAFCEQPNPRDTLPPWIDVDDVARATLAGLVPAPPSDDEVLSSAPWVAILGHDGEVGACVIPVTTKDDRLPISCEATATPTTWSVADVPAGPYWVYGYTYDPPVNVWTPRVGVVVVHDGDPAAVAPWVALTAPTFPATMSPSAAYEIRGCAGGSGAARVVVELARTNEPNLDDPSVWTAVGEAPVQGAGDFVVSLDGELLGSDAWNRAYVVRARVLDEQDATAATGHALGTLALRASATSTDPSDLRTPPDWCGLGIDDVDPPATSAGCGISDPRRTAWPLFALLLGVGALRSRVRRRGSTSR